MAGRVLLKDNVKKAAALFARASLLNPDDYAARSLRGLCFRALNRTEEASEAFSGLFCRSWNVTSNSTPTIRVPSPWDPGVFAGSATTPAPSSGQTALCLWIPRNRRYSTTSLAVMRYSTDRNKSVDCLEKAFRQGFGHKEWIQNDPDLSLVRDHPRFRALMQRLSADRST